MPLTITPYDSQGSKAIAGWQVHTPQLKFASSACSSFQLSFTSAHFCFLHDTFETADFLHGHHNPCPLAHLSSVQIWITQNASFLLPTTPTLPERAAAGRASEASSHDSGAADSEQDVLLPQLSISRRDKPVWLHVCPSVSACAWAPCGQLLGACKECHNVGFFVETDSISDG